MTVLAILNQALEWHRAGRYAEAAILYRKALVLAPDDANAWNLLGLTERRDGAPDRARVSIQRAVRVNPMFADALLNLASLWLQAENVGAMLSTLTLLALVDPANPDLWHWYGGGMTAFRQPALTVAAYRRCLMIDPTRHPVRQALLASLAEQIRNDPANADDSPTVRSDRPVSGPRLSVIICSINPQKFAAVTANIAALLNGSDYELIGIHDARSLCEGYNRGLRQATGDLLIFCHDDIEILAPDFETRLRAHLERFDVIGVAGTTRQEGANWMHSGWPHQYGQIAHRRIDPAYYRADVYAVGGGPTPDAQALDGLFLACRRAVAENIGFDEALLDGFHLYDLDFTLSAFQAGYRLAVCHDLHVIHASTGRADDSWVTQAERFLGKHHGRIPHTAAGPNPARYAPLLTRAQVRAFFSATIALEARGWRVLPES